MNHFDLAADISRSHAIALMAEQAISPYTIAQEKEMEDRADMLDAARESDINDMASALVDTTDTEQAKELCDWLMDKLWDIAPVERLRLIQQCPALLPILANAAREMATQSWDEKYPASGGA